MLLPALYIQARYGKGIFKKYSFSEAKKDFSHQEWDIMDQVSVLREEWSYNILSIKRYLISRVNPLSRFFAKKYAPRIPFHLEQILTPAFYEKMQNLKPVEEFLRECAQLHSDAFTHMALARYLYNEQDYEGALSELGNALELDPGFWGARKYMGEILLERDMQERALVVYGELIPHLNVPYLKFQCSNCGFKPSELQWQCPQCRNWDTIDFEDSRKIRTNEARELPEGDDDSLPQTPEEDL